MGATVTEMLNKHRESLDAQYRAGIRAIEEAFKVGEAKDPQQFRRLTEELWKHSIEYLKTVAEAQTRDVQAAMEKFYEVASKSAMKLQQRKEISALGLGGDPIIDPPED